MYKNIICNETHKKALLPDNIKTKLEMLVAVTSMSAVAAVSFSGCNTTKQDVEYTQPKPTSSYVQELTQDDTSSKIKHNKSYTELTTEEETQETETQETEIQETEIQETEPQEESYVEESEEYIEETPKPVDSQLEELYSTLEDICNQKSFEGETKLLLFDILTNLYNNYSTWQNGYEDMPNVLDYINENFITILRERVNEIKFIDSNSEEGQSLLNEGLPAGYTSIDDGKLTIKIITEKKEDANEDQRSYSVQELFHEIIHCKQKKILFNSDYFDENSNISQLFTEGGATFHQKFTNPYSTDIFGMWSISNEDGTKTIDYNKDDAIGYLVHLNGYEKLVYLLGYRFIDKVEKGEIPYSEIGKEFSKQYKQKGIDFYATFTNWFEEYQVNGWQGDEIYKLSVDVEKKFLDIAKTKNQKRFNQYIEKNLPTFKDEDGKDITKEVLETNKDNTFSEER